MPISICCPHCRMRYAVADAARGKLVQCTQCQIRFEAVPEVQLPATGPPPRAANPLGHAAPGNVFDDDLLSSAAGAPALDRLKPSRAAGVRQPKARKIRAYEQDGRWYARVSPEQIVSCPAIWLLGVATLIGLAMVFWAWTGTQVESSFGWAALGVGGGAWVIGFFLLHHYYYKVWSDFGEREFVGDEAPEPGWMKFVSYGALCPVLFALFAFSRAGETTQLKQQAFAAFQFMSTDQAAVKAAIEEYHFECFLLAQEGVGKRSRTNLDTYLAAMRHRLHARFPQQAPPGRQGSRGGSAVVIASCRV